MKVLTFISSIDLTGGGPSRSVPMLVKGLAEAGLDATLMTTLRVYEYSCSGEIECKD